MRIHFAAAIAALGVATPSLADPSGDASLAFYPAAARAAGVEGEATLSCARDAHLALRDCALVFERPSGQGFGAAALAMAARSPDNLALNVTDAALLAARPITVRFRLRPPSIDPDLTEMAHVVKRPQITQQPTPFRVGLYYPERAMKAGVSGSGSVHCHVSRQGELVDCAVLSETPAGDDFGAAATEVAEREYKMSPLLLDGKPTDQGEANLQIDFKAR